MSGDNIGRWMNRGSGWLNLIHVHPIGNLGASSIASSTLDSATTYLSTTGSTTGGTSGVVVGGVAGRTFTFERNSRQAMLGPHMEVIIVLGVIAVICKRIIGVVKAQVASTMPTIAIVAQRPQRISAGSRRPVIIYILVDRVVKIFGHHVH